MALSSFPRTTTLVDAANKITGTWQQWLDALLRMVNASPVGVGSVALTDQSAAAASTAVPIQSVVASLYRVSYAARISQAATVSSSLTVTVHWTSGGVGQSQAGAAMTGNTTATQQNAGLVINADAGTTINYELTYASVGATPMHYDFSVTVEALP